MIAARHREKVLFHPLTFGYGADVKPPKETTTKVWFVGEERSVNEMCVEKIENRII